MPAADADALAWPGMNPPPEFGLELRDAGLTGAKNVEGFMSGNALSEGGGMEVGKI